MYLECLVKRKKEIRAQTEYELTLPLSLEWSSAGGSKCLRKSCCSQVTIFWWNLQDRQMMVPLKYLQNNLLIKQYWVFLLIAVKENTNFILIILAMSHRGSQSFSIYEFLRSGIRWVSKQGIWVGLPKAFMLQLLIGHRRWGFGSDSFTIICLLRLIFCCPLHNLNYSPAWNSFDLKWFSFVWIDGSYHTILQLGIYITVCYYTLSPHRARIRFY